MLEIHCRQQISLYAGCSSQSRLSQALCRTAGTLPRSGIQKALHGLCTSVVGGSLAVGGSVALAGSLAVVDCRPQFWSSVHEPITS